MWQNTYGYGSCLTYFQSKWKGRAPVLRNWLLAGFALHSRDSVPKKTQALATSRGVLVVPVALFVHHGYRLHVPNQKQRPGISSAVLLPAGVVHPRDYVPKRGRILSVRAGCRTTLRKMPFRPPNISQSTCDFRHGKSNTCPQNSHFSHWVTLCGRTWFWLFNTYGPLHSPLALLWFFLEHRIAKLHHNSRDL